MIHPKIFLDNSIVLYIEGPELARLIKKPKSVLWVRRIPNKEIYAIVPVELIKEAINSMCKNNCRISFKWDGAVEIPKETGIAMRYNGEEEK